MNRNNGQKTEVQKRIEKMLEERGLGDLYVAQLARRWDESPQAVHQFFDKPEECHLATAMKYCRHLGCSLNDLYGETY